MPSKGFCYKIKTNGKYLSLLSPHNIYIHVYMYFVNTDVVVIDCQLGQEGGTIYLEMMCCASFETQMTNFTM
jgi:hypothetical protein